MKKRIIATIMAGVMTLSMLAGCGQEEKTPSTSSSQKVESTSPSSEEKVESTAKEETPKEPVKVTWYMYGKPQEEHDLVMEDLNKKLREKINVEMELVQIPTGEYNEKMKLYSTSGDKYEMCWTSNWVNTFESNMSRGAFMALDDLLKEYGQGILEQCPDWLLDMGKVNGVQYAIPNLQIVGKGFSFYIQKKYADEYGWDKEIVNSYEEIYPFLDWIKEKYPDVVPLSADGAEGYPVKYEALGDHLVYSIKDGNIQAGIVSEYGIRTKKDLYDKGYVREDIATVTSPNGDRNTGRYAVIYAAGKPGGETQGPSSWGGEYIQVRVGEKRYITATTGQATMTAFNINADQPEAAMKLLNLMWTDKEIFNELLFGLEGVHYKKTGENTVELIEGSKYYYGGNAWKYANQFNAWTIPTQSPTVWEETEALNNSAEVSPIVGFVPDFSEYQTIIAQLNSVSKEFSGGYYDTDDVDAWFKERNEKYYAAGLQTLVDGVQAQLDAWKKANNK